MGSGRHLDIKLDEARNVSIVSIVHIGLTKKQSKQVKAWAFHTTAKDGEEVCQWYPNRVNVKCDRCLAFSFILRN